MMEIIACANCGVDDTVPAFSKAGFKIVTCRNCQLAYVNPRSFTAESDDYFRGRYLEAMELNYELRPAIRELYRSILADLSVQFRAGRLLDIGCAMGHFVKFASDDGWDAHGVECSTYAVAYGNARWRLPIHGACELSEAHFPADHFDVCTLIETAGQLPHPEATLREVHRILKPGGMIYFTTPNFASFKSLLLREQWNMINPTGRLYYFTAHSLGQLLRTSQFENVWDLTAPQSLQREWEAIQSSGTTSLSREQFDRIAEQTRIEDESKLTNGRAEGLKMAAFKPTDGNEQVASLRSSASHSELNNKLVTTGGSDPEGQKVYLLQEGRKHWAVSARWLAKHGYSLQDTMQVSPETLAAYFPGEPLGLNES